MRIQHVSAAFVLTVALQAAAVHTPQSQLLSEIAAEHESALRALAAFEADYDVSITAILLNREPRKVYTLSERCEWIIDGDCGEARIETEEIWFPDDRSPAEIKPLKVVATLSEGCVVRTFSGGGARSRDDAHRYERTGIATDPRVLWQHISGQYLHELLKKEKISIESGTLSDGDPVWCIAIADAFNHMKNHTVRLWLQQSPPYFPRIVEYGSNQTKEFFPSYQVEIQEIGETEEGHFYPKVVAQRLYAGTGSGRICYTERVFTCTRFVTTKLTKPFPR